MIFIDNGLAIQLKEARSNTGYSQNDVATILHITRQSVSKWERGIVYPDLDNLIRLSDIYKVSIDDLVNKNSELKSQIKLNNKKIKEQKEKLGKVNTQLYQNTNEGIFLLILVLASAVVPPIGVVLPIYVMWRNTKYNSFHKTIYIASIVVVLISLWGTAIFINDNWLEPTHTEIYRVNE